MDYAFVGLVVSFLILVGANLATHKAYKERHKRIKAKMIILFLQLIWFIVFTVWFVSEFIIK
jgi:hypothetical protein